MYDKKYLYSFDPTGELADNAIPDELHIINPASGSDFDIIIPKYAPFFKKSLYVKHTASGQTLTEGIHFDLGYRFEAASTECVSPIYAAIVITDRTLTGQLRVSYQTLGGEWVMDTQDILEIIATTKNDPRTVKWDNIINKPIEFPPSNHLHNVKDMVGFDDVTEAIAQVTSSIGIAAGKALTSLLEHIRDHANPHHVSLGDLGLNEVGELAEATEIDVDKGTDNLRFITSRRLQYFYNTKVKDGINAHSSREDNPHNVTKEQVGLGSVDNYRMATLAEAMEGILATRNMSPALVQALVADRIKAALDVDPIPVTKDSVGLGNVQNYPMANFEQAIAGTSEEYYMSPLRTAQHTSNAVENAIKLHLQANNPHGISKTTIGLGNVQDYPIANDSELKTGTADNRYVTVAGVTTMIHNTRNTLSISETSLAETRSNRVIILASTPEEVDMLKGKSKSTPIYDVSTSVLWFYDNGWGHVPDAGNALEVGKVYHTEVTGKTFLVQPDSSVVLISITR